MSHPRQVIRDAVVALLKGATDAQDRVLKARRVPWREKELPGILVTWKSEQVPYPTRTLELLVVGVVAMPDAGDVDDALDTLAAQVEAVIAADRTLSGTAIVAKLTGTEVEAIDDQRLSAGAIHLTFEVRYAA